MVLWQAVKAHAKPGAPIFIMDLLRPESQQIAKHLMEQYAGDEPDVLKNDFYNSLLAAFEIQEVRDQLRQCGLQHLQVEQVSDRHLTVSGFYQS
jgi:hypothetical protein